VHVKWASERTYFDTIKTKRVLLYKHIIIQIYPNLNNDFEAEFL